MLETNAVLTHKETEILTSAERQLLILFNSGSAAATADTLRQALPDIYCKDERVAAVKLITKLDSMGEVAFIDFPLTGLGFESGEVYA